MAAGQVQVGGLPRLMDWQKVRRANQAPCARPSSSRTSAVIPLRWPLSRATDTLPLPGCQMRTCNEKQDDSATSPHAAHTHTHAPRRPWPPRRPWCHQAPRRRTAPSWSAPCTAVPGAPCPSHRSAQWCRRCLSPSACLCHVAVCQCETRMRAAREQWTHHWG